MAFNSYNMPLSRYNYPLINPIITSRNLSPIYRDPPATNSKNDNPPVDTKTINPIANSVVNLTHTNKGITNLAISEEVADEIFDMAGFFIKNYMELYIAHTVKRVNDKLKTNAGNGLLVISGGAALSRYFNAIPEFITLDFDLKLIYPINVSIADQLRFKERDIPSIVDIFDTTLNQYFLDFPYDIFEAKFPGVIFETNAIDHLGHFERIVKGDLHTYGYTMKFDKYTRVEHVIDVYPVTPNMTNISHYNVFTGVKKHNEILSRTANITKESGKPVYYAPINYINEIPYFGLGYILWDTQRMINDTIMYGNPKLTRYVNKYNGIIQGLDSLQYSGSCAAFSGLINACSSGVDSCNSKKTTNEMIDKLIALGYFPDNRRYIQLIISEFSEQFICDQYHHLRSYPEYSLDFLLSTNKELASLLDRHDIKDSTPEA
jgi:hypothetical protein